CRLVTETSDGLSPLYWESVVVAAAVMVGYACGLASPTRVAPVIVTVWALFQFPFENVSEAVETVPSLVFELLIPIFTFAFGLLVSTTVNAAVLPASVVV